MSEQNSAQEKTHEASEQKLEQARKKGDFARSMDAQAAAAYVGFSLAILLTGTWSMVHIGETLMTFLSRPHELATLFLSPAAPSISLDVFTRVASGAAPLLLMPGGMVLLLLLAQRAIVFAPDKVKPKLSRLSPISNAKNKYGPNGLMEFLKSAIKLVAVSVVLAIAVLAEVDRLPAYTQIGPRFLPELLGHEFWNIATGVLFLAFCIALIDIMWQRHSHAKKMRMSHQEVKDEHKQSDGDPHMRATRRERAREIANNRMLHDVPTADVVIVNPIHYAVALKWDRSPGSVPICVAKGVDEIAQRIRLRAEQAGVPVQEDPPTARSLHATVDVGHPVSPDHYKAVAAAIVFADKLRAAQRERQGGL